MNPMSRPSWRNTEVSPHIPGFFRPQLQHTSSLTPTSLPHEGQRVEPVRWRPKSMAEVLYQGQTRTDTDEQGQCSSLFVRVLALPLPPQLRDQDPPHPDIVGLQSEGALV